jgi:hypothetical protein
MTTQQRNRGNRNTVENRLDIPQVTIADSETSDSKLQTKVTIGAPNVSNPNPPTSPSVAENPGNVNGNVTEPTPKLTMAQMRQAQIAAIEKKLAEAKAAAGMDTFIDSVMTILSQAIENGDLESPEGMSEPIVLDSLVFLPATQTFTYSNDLVKQVAPGRLTDGVRKERFSWAGWLCDGMKIPLSGEKSINLAEFTIWLKARNTPEKIALWEACKTSESRLAFLKIYHKLTNPTDVVEVSAEQAKA